MAEVIGESLSIGLGIALSPIPIVAVVLMLTTPRAHANAPALLIGWVLGLAVVGAVLLVIANDAGLSKDSGSGDSVDSLKIVLGTLLVSVAGLQWLRRPRLV